MMAVYCVWCGDAIEEVKGLATMDTCEECEEYFEDNIDNIALCLNSILMENEELKLKDDKDKNVAALKSYSLITAIHMLGVHPKIEFKDSKFIKYLPKK